MFKIWKYPVSMEDVQTIQLPEAAEILTIQTQHGLPCMWVLLDPEAPKQLRHFTLYGTNHVVPEQRGKYIDTFQMYNDELVFHVFEDT